MIQNCPAALGVIRLKKMLKKNIYMPVIVALLYTVYYYLVLNMMTARGLLVDLNKVTWSTVGTRFLTDFSVMLLFPVIIILVHRRSLNDFYISFVRRKVTAVLGSILLILFILHNDYTVSGFYKLFFHLIVVAFAEEFLFRGYVYSMMKRYSKTSAVLVSGILWGSMHAILPGLVAGEQLGEIGLNMISQLGFGIAAGYYFIYIMEKSASLFVPVLVHAILNYTVGPIGIITAVGTGLYLILHQLKNDKKAVQNKDDHRDKSASY